MPLFRSLPKVNLRYYTTPRSSRVAEAIAAAPKAGARAGSEFKAGSNPESAGAHNLPGKTNLFHTYLNDPFCDFAVFTSNSLSVSIIKSYLDLNF